MKTKNRFLLVLAMMFASATGAWAQQSWDCGNTKVTLSDEGVLTVSAVTGTDGKMADYENENSMPWADYRWNFKSIVVENGVTYIGKRTFCNASNAKTISIGKDATAIADSAFMWCSAANSITISEGVKSIGERAFFGCHQLRNLTLPASLESIDSEALTNNNLTGLFVKATTPPTLADNQTVSAARIYVPEASLNAYKTAEYWSNLSYYIDIDFSDNYISFTYDFGGFTTFTGTAWKGIEQTVGITPADGFSITGRTNIDENNQFTPAKDATEYSYAVVMKSSEAAGISFEQVPVTANLLVLANKNADLVTISAGTPDEKGMIADIKAGKEISVSVKEGYKLRKTGVFKGSIITVTGENLTTELNGQQGDAWGVIANKNQRKITVTEDGYVKAVADDKAQLMCTGEGGNNVAVKSSDTYNSALQYRWVVNP